MLAVVPSPYITTLRDSARSKCSSFLFISLISPDPNHVLQMPKIDRLMMSKPFAQSQLTPRSAEMKNATALHSAQFYRVIRARLWKYKLKERGRMHWCELPLKVMSRDPTLLLRFWCELPAYILKHTPIIAQQLRAMTSIGRFQAKAR